MIDVKYNGSESRVYPPLATFPRAAVVNKVGLENLQTQPNGRKPHFNTNRTSIIININRNHYLRNKQAEKVGADFIDDCGKYVLILFLPFVFFFVRRKDGMDGKRK